MIENNGYEFVSEEHKKLFELLLVFKNICDSEGIWYSLAYGSMLGAVRHAGFIPWDYDADVFIKITDKNRFRDAFKKANVQGIVLHNYDKDKHYIHSHDALGFQNADKDTDVHLDIYPLIGAPSNEKEQAKFTKNNVRIDKIFRSKYVNIKLCKKKNKPLVACAKVIDFFIPDHLMRKILHERENRYNFNTSRYWVSHASYGKASNCMPKEIWEDMIEKSFCGIDFKIPSNWDMFLTRCYGDYMTPKKY